MDSKSDDILESVGKELKERPPEILAKTRRNKGSGAAESQRVAILLSKARKRGAKVPAKKSI